MSKNDEREFAEGFEEASLGIPSSDALERMTFRELLVTRIHHPPDSPAHAMISHEMAKRSAARGDASAAVAKLQATGKAIERVLDDEHKQRGGLPLQNYAAEQVERYFTEAATALEILRRERAPLYEDFREIYAEPDGLGGPGRYSRAQLEQLRTDVLQILEIQPSSLAASSEGWIAKHGANLLVGILASLIAAAAIFYWALFRG